MEESFVFGRRGCIVVDGTRREEKGGVEGVGGEGVRHFINEVSRLSGSIVIVCVLCYCQIFVAVTSMEVRMLDEGGIGGCNGCRD